MGSIVQDKYEKGCYYVDGQTWQVCAWNMLDRLGWMHRLAYAIPAAAHSKRPKAAKLCSITMQTAVHMFCRGGSVVSGCGLQSCVQQRAVAGRRHITAAVCASECNSCTSEHGSCKAAAAAVGSSIAAGALVLWCAPTGCSFAHIMRSCITIQMPAYLQCAESLLGTVHVPQSYISKHHTPVVQAHTGLVYGL
jgi:hypothetical protein